jgi:HSP20 family protein
VLRFDPFSDLDALTRGLLTSQTGSNRTPRFMPMDLCKIDVAHGGALKSITVDAD